MTRPCAAFALALFVASLGCGRADQTAPSNGELEVHGARVEPSAAGHGPAGGFLTLVNESDRAWVLVGASSPDAGRVELHRSWIEGGVARMAPVETARVEAGEHFVFEPGGHHLMIFDAPALAAAGEFTLRLEFEGGEVRDVTARVSKPGDPPGHSDHGSHADPGAH